MKPMIFISTLAALSIAFSACNKQDNPTPKDSLTEQEKADLLFMLEEEKLARDTYLDLASIWSEPQFGNIAASEQRHMDAIVDLLNTYEIEYEILDHGLFADPELQQLYNDLSTQGQVSNIAGLTVGATIEDVDIADLQEKAENTVQSDIRNTYEMLACGSRNHLRAFVSGLGNYGETYSPQFLTQAEFDEIIAGSHENCGSH